MHLGKPSVSLNEKHLQGIAEVSSYGVRALSQFRCGFASDEFFPCLSSPQFCVVNNDFASTLDSDRCTE